jgi:thymidylate synthase
MITNLSINESNLSYAWARAFLATLEKGGDTRHPSVVTINNLDDGLLLEDMNIRNRLDKELGRHDLNLCKTVSNTIFPLSMWHINSSNDLSDLFARYERAWPGIKKCPANRNGVYFRRLTNYQPKDASSSPVNQLQCVIDTYRSGNHRKSALQASIFDPTRDHSNQRQKGFPCMQQIAFTPLPNDKLSITGIYATQLQFEKAYGNYLGLYWLGRFMAKQLGLTLTQVICMATVVQRSHHEKTKELLTPFAADIRAMLPVST